MEDAGDYGGGVLASKGHVRNQMIEHGHGRGLGEGPYRWGRKSLHEMLVISSCSVRIAHNLLVLTRHYFIVRCIRSDRHHMERMDGGD